MTLTRGAVALAFACAWLCTNAAGAADPMVTTDDLLKDPKFKTVYLGALGPRAKEKWLATMTNSALVTKVAVAGDAYQMATPCKPHDCGDNNLLLLYSPAKGVYGKLYEKGRTTLLGAPGPVMTAELERLWKKEFRQQ
jgi:hypothetical protein